MPNTIIFSDLDGTLLDETTYSHEEASNALKLIRDRCIPLILCSSKTRAEMERYRSSLGIVHPFITENGGGIFIPAGYFSVPVEAEVSSGYQVSTLGRPYADIVEIFGRLRERLNVHVRGFAEMTAEEISALTGLSRENAKLAKQRDFDEPFIFEGDPDGAFLREIESAGLHWTRGGRLYHITGNHDKGRAVNILKMLYARQYGAISAIGLGDALNDLPLLQAVDRPVLVMRGDGSFDPGVTIEGLLKTTLPGPAGWNESVNRLLMNQEAGERARCRIRWRGELLAIFHSALAAVDSHDIVLSTVKLEGNTLLIGEVVYTLDSYERIMVIGAGKAAARMALALEELLHERISGGLVIVKEGHKASLRRLDQIEASHPIPDLSGVEGTERLLELVRSADEKTLILCLFSGGASALLVAPVNGVTLQEKQRVTALLLNAGATIEELNAVRKHLSAVKGGGLARAAYPARVVTLLLSDVIGDRIDVIASGPTAPDGSSFADAWSVIEKYNLTKRVPAGVGEYLRRGMEGLEPETVKEGDPCLAGCRNEVIGGIGLALRAAREGARRLGFDAKIISAELQGEARDAAHRLALHAHKKLEGLRAGQISCLLFGGETTVTVAGSGRGGRNQELALAFAREVKGISGLAMLSAGTDGSDGATDAAGAMVDGDTAALAERLGLEPERYLSDNDSYTFFQRLDAVSGVQSHFITGATGTNVMDLQIILCGRKEMRENESAAVDGRT
jgi:hydroxypyruvate reductase